MKLKTLSFLCCSIFIFIACEGDPNEWNEERKQIITDKCDNEVFDCDCYLNTTMEHFPNAQDYNTTLENESENQENIDDYWDKLYDECMSE